MKDRLVPIDRKKHLLYSRALKKIVRRRLRETCPDRSETLWEQIQTTYADFLGDLPYCGGRHNFQARGIYDSIMLLACCEVLHLTLEELEDLNNALFVSPRQSPASLNWPWAMRAAQAIFSHIGKKARAHRQDWPGNYHMEVLPLDPKLGVRYRFHSCPIADFAAAHGYTPMMPALCNADYPMLRSLHGGLIRRYTCANGPFCDYCIPGDENPVLKDYPVFRDEAGFLRNADSPFREEQGSPL